MPVSVTTWIIPEVTDQPVQLPQHRIRSSEHGCSGTIAFCGTRGLPARYGGFETAVDEISTRLLDMGYKCLVFCRRSGAIIDQDCHSGRISVYVRGSRIRVLDTLLSSIHTGLLLMLHRREIKHCFFFNNANVLGIILARAGGIPVTVNVDGLEWCRKKWSWPLRICALLSSAIVTRTRSNLICDSRAMVACYQRAFGASSSYIPYGPAPRILSKTISASEVLERYGVEPGRYFLQITRFEPENYPLDIALAFQATGLHEQGFRMLIIGHQFASRYSRKLMNLNGVAGLAVSKAVFDRTELSCLRQNCWCYVHGNSVGGTNPGLLDAMAGCPRVMAVDCEFNREVLGDTGSFFTPSPAGIRQSLIDSTKCDCCADQMRARVASRYDWGKVAVCYQSIAEGAPLEYEMDIISTDRCTHLRPQQCPTGRIS